LPAACLLAAVIAAGGAAAWTLDLAETVEVGESTVHLADLTRAPVPAAAAELVVAAGGRPGAEVTVTARAILRRLVMADLAADVALRGAERCRIVFAGRTVESSELSRRIQELLTPQIPAAAPEAPPSWLALELPAVQVQAGGDWEVAWPEPQPLRPGRNLITVQLREGERRRRLSVAVELHAYARTATAVSAVPRGQEPGEASLQWVWTDLALAAGQPVTDSRALAGMRAARDLAPGEVLDQRHLEPVPLVERGERVDLVVRRGSIEAVVRAECRQDGLLGETVSVINELTGRPVVARVAGPGVVTLGR
jgi:flagella basal body P-ring formation protein FlgA